MSELAVRRVELPPARPRTAWIPRGASLGQVLVIVLAVVVGFLVLYPIAMLLLGSIAPPRGATDQLFSLEGYRTALTDDAARTAAWTTIWLSLVRAALALVLALFLAWAIARTDVPFGGVFHALLIVHFFLPVLPQVLAWIFLLSPRTGIVNVALRGIVGSDAPSGPFNVFSYEGIAFVGVLNWAAFLYLFIAPAFRAVDARFEEAARMAGATGVRALRRIAIPLLWPAILGAFGISFVRQAESFEPELLLGIPANIYVFTTQVYAYIGQDLLPRYPPAIALSTLFVGLTAAMILLQQRVIGGRSFVTVSGKDYRAAPSRLGVWRWPVLVALVAYNALALGLPTGFLVLGSLQRSIARPTLEGFTLDHWKLAASPTVVDAMNNTLLVGGIASTVGIALVAVVSYIVVRTRFALRRPLDVLTWVPYMVPSFVLGVGFLWAALRGIPLPFVLYGSIALLVVAFVVRLMPLGSRLMNGTMVQLSAELEEASRMSGATWTRTFRRIVLPLLAPALAIGWLMFMAVVIRDLSTIVLIFGPRSQLLSVTFYSYWRAAALEDAAVVGLLMTGLGLLMAAGFALLQRLTSASTRATI